MQSEIFRVKTQQMYFLQGFRLDLRPYKLSTRLYSWTFIRFKAARERERERERKYLRLKYTKLATHSTDKEDCDVNYKSEADQNSFKLTLATLTTRKFLEERQVDKGYYLILIYKINKK